MGEKHGGQIPKPVPAASRPAPPPSFTVFTGSWLLSSRQRCARVQGLGFTVEGLPLRDAASPSGSFSRTGLGSLI